ncbi:fibronectin type III domain-containing protein [Paenibacillus thalictri]|uniref:Fibronectin type-III domain-containing protein n=1 Tax=Paenibacillus thalictri TaxID=2527873 RepID=A0A4Q9DM11_9BACL|nr:fibronectin type III domain-containing protein [Paenibacillus thalictri]TBL76252.1 hypothetical protein EYB31_19810 [Paenibacillus thalictri]
MPAAPTVPDQPNLLAPTNGSYFRDVPITFSWTYFDIGGLPQTSFSIEISYNNFSSSVFSSGWINSSATSYTWSGYPYGGESHWFEGVTYWRITVMNSAYGASPVSAIGYFTVDSQAPTIGSITVEQRTNQPTQRMYIYGVADTGSGVDAVHAYILNLAGSAWAGPFLATSAGSGIWYYDFNLAYEGNGTHIVRFWVYDKSGNGMYIDSSIVYDTVPPYTSNIVVDSITAGTISIHWNPFNDPDPSSGGWKNAYITVTDSTGTVQLQVIPIVSSSTTYTVAGLSAGTTYRIAVQYQDNAGNVSAANWAVVTTNSVPFAPGFINIVSGEGYFINQRPQIKVRVLDPNGDTLVNTHIQISDVNTFASTIVDSYSASNPGWSSATAMSNTDIAYNPQVDLGTGIRYVRLQSYDGKDWGNWSYTFAFIIKAPDWIDTISDTATAVNKAWIDQLRTHINGIRAARGISPAVWTDTAISSSSGNTAGTSIKAIHVNELRNALKDLAYVTGISVSFTDDPIIATNGNTPGTARKGKHWNELRNAAVLF